MSLKLLHNCSQDLLSSVLMCLHETTGICPHLAKTWDLTFVSLCFQAISATVSRHISSNNNKTKFHTNTIARITSALCTAAYLENREGRPRARRAPLHPRRAPYGRHWRDFSEEVFVVGGQGALRPEKPLEGVSGGTFRRWRAPEGALQLRFPYKTFAIGGHRTIAKDGPSDPPAYAPEVDLHLTFCAISSKYDEIWTWNLV